MWRQLYGYRNCTKIIINGIASLGSLSHYQTTCPTGQELRGMVHLIPGYWHHAWHTTWIHYIFVIGINKGVATPSTELGVSVKRRLWKEQVGISVSRRFKHGMYTFTVIEENSVYMSKCRGEKRKNQSWRKQKIILKHVVKQVVETRTKISVKCKGVKPHAYSQMRYKN